MMDCKTKSLYIKIFVEVLLFLSCLLFTRRCPNLGVNDVDTCHTYQHVQRVTSLVSGFSRWLRSTTVSSSGNRLYCFDLFRVTIVLVGGLFNVSRETPKDGPTVGFLPSCVVRSPSEAHLKSPNHDWTVLNPSVDSLQGVLSGLGPVPDFTGQW